MQNERTAKIIAEAKKLGFTMTRTRGEHMKFTKPGHQPVFTSGSPSDHRAAKNAISNLRRSAALIPIRK